MAAPLREQYNVIKEKAEQAVGKAVPYAYPATFPVYMTVQGSEGLPASTRAVMGIAAGAAAITTAVPFRSGFNKFFNDGEKGLSGELVTALAAACVSYNVGQAVGDQLTDVEAKPLPLPSPQLKIEGQTPVAAEVEKVLSALDLPSGTRLDLAA